MSKLDLKQNTGLLFRSKKKENDDDPDMYGEADVKGERFKILGYVKTSKKGTKYLAIRYYGKIIPEPNINDKTEIEKEELW